MAVTLPSMMLPTSGSTPILRPVSPFSGFVCPPKAERYSDDRQGATRPCRSIAHIVEHTVPRGNQTQLIPGDLLHLLLSAAAVDGFLQMIVALLAAANLLAQQNLLGFRLLHLRPQSV
ncbi:hypothetical protein SDC9_91816 [bioreactor metagenome]|uniref:Uncharacterized protein n=1 Tax=bioreactor metagenome TaxID=1076179 RepID=A0A644ZYW2_9ZZZZ